MNSAYAAPHACLSQILSETERQELSRQPAWLKLLQYRRTSIVFASEADGSHFFLNPNGAKDPRAELRTFAEKLCSGEASATGDPNVPSLPARCQFPARERFLREHVRGVTWPEPACPKLDEWRTRMQAQSATLVFSSYYPNNPSSVFGHTLLRLNRKRAVAHQPESPLLSHGINFAANANTANALKYMLWGLAGGFRGTFTALPYFYKVREYADFESRDIWEYDLNLNPAQVANLVDHIWELGLTHFNYYYFTENCSYHLLTAIEGAVPELNMSAHLPWWVIPVDTVKVVAETPGLVGDVHFRPSLYRQFLARFRPLREDVAARETFKQIVFNRDVEAGKNLASDSEARVLDAALDFWDFKHAHALLDQEPKVSAFKQRLLVRRANAPALPPPEIEINPQDRPDLGHGSMRYGLGAGYNRLDRGFAELDLRFSLHDLLDRSEGYPPTAAIEFFRFTLRADRNLRRPEITRANFVDILLAAPLTEFATPLSWRVTIGADRTRGLGCDYCLAARAKGQAGLTVGTAKARTLVYALVGAEARAAPALKPNFLGFDGVATLGARWRYLKSLGQGFESEIAHGIEAGRRPVGTLKTTLRFAPKVTWAIEAYARQNESRENEAGVNYFLYR